MLKCGTYPYEETDKEKHSFTYSFMLHGGNYKAGGVVQEAYKLNRPFAAFEAKGDRSLADSFSLVKCNKENVIIETVKKAENSDATVIRAYDAYNRSAKAEITFGFDVKKAYLCDLMENGGHQLQLNSINGEKLRDAQKHPENYPNLIVRVWGWSGFFNELDVEFQNHIIRRAEYTCI